MKEEEATSVFFWHFESVWKLSEGKAPLSPLLLLLLNLPHFRAFSLKNPTSNKIFWTLFSNKFHFKLFFLGYYLARCCTAKHLNKVCHIFRKIFVLKMMVGSFSIPLFSSLLPHSQFIWAKGRRGGEGTLNESRSSWKLSDICLLSSLPPHV